MKHKPTVTIGIPAYNEEANIKNLLESLIKQDETGFTIKDICIVSDGSSDKTVENTKSVIDKRIKVIDNTKRVGKSIILNRLFTKSNTDFIALLDGDVLPYSEFTIRNLIRPFMKDKTLGLVGGDLLPLKTSFFIDEAVYITRQIFRDARSNWKNGNNIYGCEGGMVGLSKNFYKQVKIPSDMIANDRFLYFSCISKGFRFKHVNPAKAWYKLPTNINDHIKQSNRFIAAHYRLSRLFPELAKSEHALPKNLVLKELLKTGLKKPIHVTFVVLLNRYCELVARKKERFMNAKWSIATTTKFGVSKNG
jgi:cellulose synthase/poly-beta-1,6-N-acetylglucosamine synthase-like glycosyltransferase